jgi:hypothetical protein
MAKILSMIDFFMKKNQWPLDHNLGFHSCPTQTSFESPSPSSKSSYFKSRRPLDFDLSVKGWEAIPLGFLQYDWRKSTSSRPSAIVCRAGVNQHVHWFHGSKGLGIQPRTSLWVGLPTSSVKHPLLRTASHTRLRARDHYTSSTLIGGKGGIGPSSLHTMLEGPMEYANARWM